MPHTFLFEEGTWKVEGEHRGAAGGRSPVSGENTIRHQPGRFECIQQRDARRYSVRGAMLEEDKLSSTWALELTRA